MPKGPLFILNCHIQSFIRIFFKKYTFDDNFLTFKIFISKTQVPFVKENCDIILLIRIESIAQLQAAHSQIQKHCTNLSTRKLQAIFIFQRSKHETELSEKKFLAKVFSLKKV